MWQSAQDFVNTHLNSITVGTSLSPIWNTLEGQGNSFFTSTVTSLVVVLWFLDLLSRWVAKYLSPTDRISIQASYRSVLNLLVWLIVLAVAYCFRVYGAPFVALPIEGACIMILGASVLKNISASSDNPILRKIGDQFSRELENRAQEMTTTVTVQPTSPPTVTVTQEPTLPTVATPKESINEGVSPSEVKNG